MRILITMEVEVHDVKKLAKHVRASLGNADDYKGILEQPNGGKTAQERKTINLVREALIAAGAAPLDIGCEILDSSGEIRVGGVVLRRAWPVD